MKRWLALAIVLVMIFSLGLSVFADHTVTITVSPSGGGTVTPSTATYPDDRTLSDKFSASAATGYDFVGWWTDKGGFFSGAEYPSIDFDLDMDRTATAEFRKQSFDVSVSCNPADGGTASGANSYSYGDTATLSASANSGYKFVNWTASGATVSSDPSYSFEVTGSRSVVANFEYVGNFHVITATVEPASSGYVNGQTSYTTEPTDSLKTPVVNIKANPVKDYKFDGWYENGTKISSVSDEIFDINVDRTIVAKFVQEVKPPEPVDPAPVTDEVTVVALASPSYQPSHLRIRIR